MESLTSGTLPPGRSGGPFDGWKRLEGTLDRLGTDDLDLYHIHRWDDETPIEETLSTLDQFVEDGKVNYLGASTMVAWKLTKALWASDVYEWERFEVTQPLHHAGYYEDVADYLDVCADQGFAVCPYSPLAGGFLTSKYERADPDDSEAVAGQTAHAGRSTRCSGTTTYPSEGSRSWMSFAR